MGIRSDAVDRTLIVGEEVRESARQYQKENLTARKKQEEAYFDKKYSVGDLVLVPEGYEVYAVGLYAFVIPYLAGLFFLFLFVADSSFEYFIEFNLGSFFVIWAIGYEVVAALLLSVIFGGWIRYLFKRGEAENVRKR